MCMSNLYVVEFDNGDKMTGSISQVYAAQSERTSALFNGYFGRAAP